VFANLTADAWAAMRSFLLLASACKEPTGAELNPLLKDVVAAMGAVDKAIKRNDWELHGKVWCLVYIFRHEPHVVHHTFYITRREY
jgi:hypothetical protein